VRDTILSRATPGHFAFNANFFQTFLSLAL
jgi:hypothetical protein